MLFNLDSELKTMKAIDDFGLIPMSFNLGSEQSTRDKAWLIRLTPMSFNLGSELLFSNLYLIVT